MLPKRSRLTSAQVREILKTGRSVRAEGLSAKYVPAKSAKAAVVVSAKVAPQAVERNRLRRLVYEVLGSSLPKERWSVFFVQHPKITNVEVLSLCSKLS